jgi:predicted DNA-binding WGR domain protein
MRANRSLGRFNGRLRERHVARLDQIMTSLEEVNAQLVLARVRHRFLDHVRIASLPAAQLSAEQKEFKKQYSRGRRELEHECGKTMRYKPIRDLVAGDPGIVIQDLKPVWLMSPLSVSDTLPLDAKQFDVVIFDEASQITLEESVPTLFRSNQAIVVGDEMQLPPTNFFSAKTADDEESLQIQEGEEVVEYDLGGNSFLNHASRNLASTMLGWHYRSRSESLISFSNAAFYQGQLLTVPDERQPTPGLPPIRAIDAQDGEQNVDKLLARSLSFHFMENAVYETRRNRMEAAYIAHLVRGLLKRQTGRSIGIVAFSEAQQAEIESALADLARHDDGFRTLLEAECEREENDQFVGLLVKNLENIQGDERDIVIMSVCYGRGPDGKMRMNFGPINQSGGEKRLNVAFSRAKHHMALVSSIQYGDITNEYNDGANCLRNYLRYAAAVSCGDIAAAQAVLREMTATRNDRAIEPNTANATINQLSEALLTRCFEVHHDVGQSHFRCDLAVRSPGEHVYRLGILVDTPRYYEQTDLIERDLMRPKLLKDFGWTVTHVLTKDWYDDPQLVLKRLDALLAGEAPDLSADETDAADAAATSPVASSAAVETVEAAVVHNSASSQAAGQTPDEAVAVTPPVPSVPTSAAPQSSASELGDWHRYFEFRQGNSQKFWEVWVRDNCQVVRFGRIGSKGQTLERQFPDHASADRDSQRLVREKLAKGYLESILA